MDLDHCLEQSAATASRSQQHLQIDCPSYAYFVFAGVINAAFGAPAPAFATDLPGMSKGFGPGESASYEVGS